MKKRIHNQSPESKVLLLSQSGSRSGKNRERKEVSNTAMPRWRQLLEAAATSVC
jgi:hypothetical protein